MDDKKALIHAQSWDVYMNIKGKVINGGYLVEVSSHDRKNFIC